MRSQWCRNKHWGVMQLLSESGRTDTLSRLACMPKAWLCSQLRFDIAAAAAYVWALFSLLLHGISIHWTAITKHPQWMHFQPLTGSKLPVCKMLNRSFTCHYTECPLAQPSAQNSPGSTKDCTRSHSCVNMLRGRLLKKNSVCSFDTVFIYSNRLSFHSLWKESLRLDHQKVNLWMITVNICPLMRNDLG